jgi:predicted hotdog family 3-hydroxylacyl-ACP dehydratase
MHLDHAQIAARIPHAGSMCLLHEIFSWDEHFIHARAISHRLIDNPLRNPMGLGIAAGIEYAAQAMAVHGNLVSTSGVARPGRLASTRGIHCRVRWLHLIDDDLDIVARKIMGDDTGMVYDFEISARQETLLTGRASIALSPT